MLAVKGLCNDGQIVFKKKLLFEEFSGSVDRMIDVKAEKWRRWTKDMRVWNDMSEIEAVSEEAFCKMLG